METGSQVFHLAGRHTILTLRIKKVLHLARWGETAALGSCFYSCISTMSWKKGDYPAVSGKRIP